MKIQRNSEQIKRLESLKLHEVMHEADVNPDLYMPVERPGMDVGEMITRQNEINDIHHDGEFEQVVADSSFHYHFYLKLDGSETIVDLLFDGDEIKITNASEAEISSLLKIAASLDADLFDEFGKPIAQPATKKSFWSFLGF
ncbi:MAG: hypothetical protein KKE30_18090 [Gammaproteobacteria bacterium]|nr:hypothetical protein [Gammaproteobacteria bacterium]MBU1554793.1 hypothetical protein [Gammaproteobacteria bacterium]MBU2069368.1 hypothetical protein [Gammaproteobacteria bacterium]MBU2184426.1 hypothetical protein [Gammaproteobacteria bacterium]MBU2203079.1 hypothetical protein [Gammaproteobacteria bacterium]